MSMILDPEDCIDITLNGTTVTTNKQTLRRLLRDAIFGARTRVALGQKQLVTDAVEYQEEWESLLRELG